MTTQSDPNVQSIYCIIFGAERPHWKPHSFRRQDHKLTLAIITNVELYLAQGIYIRGSAEHVTQV